MHRVRSVPPIVALLLGLASIVLLWPGVATYDTLSQYTQATTGRYDDWHPPIMARLWSLLLGAGLPGTGPMLVLQWGLFWAGIGLLSAALVRADAPRAAIAALAVPLFPPTASWMACVLKDSQLVGALAAATGIVAWFRLSTGRLPGWAIALAGLLLGYAVLLRANAVFSVVPLALALGHWAGVRQFWTRAALLVAACALLIAVSGPIDHRLLGAEHSDVERTLPLFDMAGIAHRVPLATLPDLPPAIWRQAEATHCYTPFYWDPLGDRTKCGVIATRLAFDRDEDAPSIVGEWIAMIAHHPIAYAEHRFAHLNATLRIAVPAGERLAVGPSASLADPSRLGEPATPAAHIVGRVALWIAATPLGVPALWLLLACGLGWTLVAVPPQPARDIGLALILSAILQTASFAVVSIASDLRYHLWPIVATMLAATMLAACRGVPQRRLATTLVVFAFAVAGSAWLRGHVAGPIG